MKFPKYKLEFNKKVIFIYKSYAQSKLHPKSDFSRYVNTGHGNIWTKSGPVIRLSFFNSETKKSKSFVLKKLKFGHKNVVQCLCVTV
jgi:hypothetical protein